MSAILLDDVVAFIRRYVVLTDVQADTLALWTAHTHAIDAAETTPYLAITSPEKRSGKTRLLEVLELSRWRATLPARSRHQLFGAFKQVLEEAVTLGLLEANPCARIRNRRTKLDEDREIRPFDDRDEVEAIAVELHPRYRAVPVVLVGTGLRPEELWGLERRDLDRVSGVLNIERVFTQGRLKPCKKSDLQRRRVPLRAKVLEALDAMPSSLRLDGPLLPGHDGDYVRHTTFRLHHWTPALRAAGIEHRASTPRGTPSPHGRSGLVCSSSISAA
jgi:integrase